MLRRGRWGAGGVRGGQPGKKPEPGLSDHGGKGPGGRVREPAGRSGKAGRFCGFGSLVPSFGRARHRGVRPGWEGAKTGARRCRGYDQPAAPSPPGPVSGTDRAGGGTDYGAAAEGSGAVGAAPVRRPAAAGGGRLVSAAAAAAGGHRRSGDAGGGNGAGGAEPFPAGRVLPAGGRDLSGGGGGLPKGGENPRPAVGKNPAGGSAADRLSGRAGDAFAAGPGVLSDHPGGQRALRMAGQGL